MMNKKWLLTLIGALPMTTGFAYDVSVKTGMRSDILPKESNVVTQMELRCETVMPLDKELDFEVEGRMGLGDKSGWFGKSDCEVYDLRVGVARHVRPSISWLSGLKLNTGLATDYQRFNNRIEREVTTVANEDGKVVANETFRQLASRQRNHWLTAYVGGAATADLFSWMQLEVGARAHGGGYLGRFSNKLAADVAVERNGGSAFGSTGWVQLTVPLFARTVAAVGVEGSSWYALSERSSWASGVVYASLSQVF